MNGKLVTNQNINKLSEALVLIDSLQPHNMIADLAKISKLIQSVALSLKGGE